MKLRNDNLSAADLSAIATLYTEQARTEGSLFEFTSVGMPLAPEMILPYFNAESFPPGEHVYTVMLASGQDLGQGTHMIQSFVLEPGSTNTLVEVTNDSTHLDYAVNLQSHQRTAIPAGTAGVTLDWSDMQRERAW